LTVFPKIAGLIREYGAQQGKELFASTAEYQTALQSSPANAVSLMVQFRRERADETFDILEAMPNDVPTPDIASWKKIDFPTLVLACRNDLLHPFEYGQFLARGIPGARFAEITGKAISEQKHVEDVRREILQFIGEMWLVQGT
jgi:pimeloyl-ACP methyl ester carboxylesterase